MKLFIWNRKCKHRFCFSALHFSDGDNNSCATRSVVIKPILWSQRSCEKANRHRLPKAGFGDFANFKLFSWWTVVTHHEDRRDGVELQGLELGVELRGLHFVLTEFVLTPEAFLLCVFLMVLPLWTCLALSLVDTWWILKSPAQNKWLRMGTFQDSMG